jgi:large subunit ribosomal protein L33
MALFFSGLFDFWKGPQSENHPETECNRKKIGYFCLKSGKSDVHSRPHSRIYKTMAKKGNRVQVIMECTEHKESGMPGTSRYITTKNRKNTPDRMEKKKYNPILKRMTVHKEIK